jgi:acetoin utilization deacetylase AcuC-like enzyme
VHDRAHIEHVRRAAAAGPAQLDPDTFVSSASYDVALLAAGASVDLALRIARGEARAGFAAVRPPGHHAEGDRAMGFCLFNNAAIAARAVQREAGVERVLLLDWDVHHGNGTQHTFEGDPSVLYVSTHQWPFYPGTGAAGEIGTGRGEGATLNVPMPAGCGDAEYVGVFQRVLAPAARAFRPDYWIVSCGFDAHEDDPLAAMRVTQSGYAALTAIVRSLADELSGGRMLFVLEGGYSLRGLREGVEALVGGLLADAPAPPAAPDPARQRARRAGRAHRRGPRRADPGARRALAPGDAGPLPAQARPIARSVPFPRPAAGHSSSCGRSALPPRDLVVDSQLRMKICVGAKKVLATGGMQW